MKKNIVPLYYGAHCSFTFDAQGILRSWKLKPTDYVDKKAFVLKIANQLKIPKEQRAYVGDDVNDVPAFSEVGLSVAFNADKAAVRRQTDVVIDSRNLKSILPHLQDYRDTEGLSEGEIFARPNNASAALPDARMRAERDRAEKEPS